MDNDFFKKLIAKDVIYKMVKLIAQDDRINSNMDLFIEKLITAFNVNENESDEMCNVYNSLGIYYEEIKKSLLSDEELKKLDERILNNDTSARNEYVTNNLKLVVSIAKKFANSQFDMSVLISAGNLGLMEASKRYIPGKGAKFSTYAVNWIMHYILEEKRDSIVKLPSNMQKDLARINCAMENFEANYQGQPDYEKLSELTGLSVNRIKKIYFHNFSILRLNGTFEDSDCELQDLVSDNIDIETKCIDKQIIEDALNLLSDIERKIIFYKYGFFDGENKTLKQTAEYIGGVTGECIRQIEKRALLKLKRSLGGQSSISVDSHRIKKFKMRGDFNGI